MTDFVGSVHPSADFSMMRNHWFRDPRLSDRAKGRLAYLATHAPGYRLTMEQQIAETKDGRDGVYAALRELVDLGYLERRQVRGPDGRLGAAYFTWGPAATLPGYERSWGRSGPASGLTRDGKPDDGLTASGEALSGEALSGGDDTKKTSSLEDQEREDQPPPPSPPPPTPPAGSGEEEADSNDHEKHPHFVAVEALQAALAAASVKPAALPRLRAAKLARLLAGRLAAGWTVGQVVDVLGEPLDGVDSVYATLHWRISNLLDGPPPPVRPPVPRPRACSCVGGVVLVANPDDPVHDLVVPCPQCRPAEASAAA